MKIHEIVKKLVGEIEPVGETNTDNERYDNLIQYIDLLYTLLQDLHDLSRHKDRGEYSIGRAGKKADSFFQYLIL